MTTRECSPISRRRFIKSTTAASAFSVTIVPRHVLGGPGHTPPSERVNFVGIGSGCRGGGVIRSMAGAGANVVALCDVDHAHAAGTFKQFPNARVYTDFREMLDKEDNVMGYVFAHLS